MSEKVIAWAVKQLEEATMIAEAKYEEVQQGKDEVPEMNYYAGWRDCARAVLVEFEDAGFTVVTKGRNDDETCC
jgi:hypothetical protein